MVCMLEKRINDSTAEQSAEIEEKLKNLEGMQLSLVHPVEEVQTTSSDIERTAWIWLPKYEAKKERRCYLWNSPQGIGREKFGNDYKPQGQALTLNNKGRPGEDPGLGGHLTIEQQQEGSAKTCQRTNIRLEGGRIQVNVSHHSAVVNQSEKRGDLVAVQS